MMLLMVQKSCTTWDNGINYQPQLVSLISFNSIISLMKRIPETTLAGRKIQSEGFPSFFWKRKLTSFPSGHCWQLEPMKKPKPKHLNVVIQWFSYLILQRTDASVARGDLPGTSDQIATGIFIWGSPHMTIDLWWDWWWVLPVGCHHWSWDFNFSPDVNY